MEGSVLPDVGSIFTGRGREKPFKIALCLMLTLALNIVPTVAHVFEPQKIVDHVIDLKHDLASVILGKSEKPFVGKCISYTAPLGYQIISENLIGLASEYQFPAGSFDEVMAAGLTDTSVSDVPWNDAIDRFFEYVTAPGRNFNFVYRVFQPNNVIGARCGNRIDGAPSWTSFPPSLKPVLDPVTCPDGTVVEPENFIWIRGIGQDPLALE